tara:strand:+ start:67 stop:279 length:213 start_codon:yes stop_codon:yes gene_type:complete
MNVGDLVKMRPAMAPPELYGIGIIMKVKGEELRGQRCYVRWPTMPARELKGCARYALELVSRALPRGEGT